MTLVNPGQISKPMTASNFYPKQGGVDLSGKKTKVNSLGG